MRRSDDLRRKVLGVGLGDKVRVRERVDAHVPQNVLDAGAKAVLGGDGEVAGVAVVDCPDLDHVAATPRRARFDPDVGEIDAGVEDDDGVLDRGFDLSEVCVCFQVKYRRPAVGLTRLRRQLNQGGRLRATSWTAPLCSATAMGRGPVRGSVAEKGEMTPQALRPFFAYSRSRP